MNEFGKVCVVFVTAASLAFVAFVGAMRSGGRNWQLEADQMDDFVLNVTPGEKTKYGMNNRRTGEPVGSESTILPEVVVAAKAKQVANIRKETTDLTEAAAQLKPGTEFAVAAVTADEKGLAVRLESLQKQYDEVSQRIAQVNTQIIEAANEAQKIRAEGQERREEVYRQQNQLELLRDDLFAAKVQRKNLEEEEVRLQEILSRLDRRRQQLVDRTTPYEPTEK